MVFPNIVLSGVLVGQFVGALLHVHFLLNDVEVLAIFTNLCPRMRFTVVPLPDFMFIITENVNALKMGLDLAGMVTNVDPLFLLPLHYLTVLLDPELGIIITINSSHLEFTDEVAVIDIPMTPHLGSTIVDFAVVSNKMCPYVLLSKRYLATFDSAFNLKFTDIVGTCAGNGLFLNLEVSEDHLSLVVILCVGSLPLLLWHTSL